MTPDSPSPNPEHPPEGTVRDWLDHRAAAGAAGFVFLDGEPDLPWALLRDEAARIAAGLTGLGLAKGESVAIMSPNSRMAVLAFFGALYGGFRATMINMAAGTDAIAYALEHCEARYAAVHPTKRDVLADTNPGGRISPLDLDRLGGTSPLYPVTPGDHALLMYTSGTTGRPKGVLHSHASLLAGGWTPVIAHGLTAADRGLCVLPICHINGLCVSVMGTLVAGGSLAMVPRFSASRFWEQASAAEATWFSVVPTIISHLLHGETDPDAATCARLRFGRSASSALAPDVHTAFETRFGVPIIETMGLTETAAQVLSNPLPPGIRKVGSPGRAYGNEVAILGPDLSPQPRGTSGEIAVRGPNMMLGYLKNEEATQATFTSNGWLRTGDLGRQDADGYVYVTGRLKELIIKGGENIAPREVDEALYAHGDVVEAAAFARPCPTYGERVEAAVRLRTGSRLTGDDLVALCVTRLGPFKSPDRVYLLDELPKGPSGKIQRLKLSEMLST